MDYRSRLESHLKSLNKLQALEEFWGSGGKLVQLGKLQLHIICGEYVYIYYIYICKLQKYFWVKGTWLVWAICGIRLLLFLFTPGKILLITKTWLQAASSCRPLEFLFVEKPSVFVFGHESHEEWNKPDCLGYIWEFVHSSLVLPPSTSKMRLDRFCFLVAHVLPFLTRWNQTPTCSRWFVSRHSTSWNKGKVWHWSTLG